MSFLILGLLPVRSNALPVKPIFFFGFGKGSSDLQKVAPEKNFDLDAGGTLLLGVGGIRLLSDTNPHAFETQLNFSFFVDSQSTEDKGSIEWRRFVVELIHYYKNSRERFRLGWGVSHHFSNKLDGEGRFSGATTNINPATGLILAVDFVPPGQHDLKVDMGIGLRYTILDYRAKNGPSVNGNSLFLVFNYLLR